MVSASATSCTACGALNQTANRFCMECGVILEKIEYSETSAPQETSVETSGSEFLSKTVKPIAAFFRRKVLVCIALTLLIGFVLGVALTSENVFSGVIGNRYTEKRMKNEKAQSYEFGFGAGSDEGYSSGFSDGKVDGCNSVFDQVGADQLIAIFSPYKSFNLGEFYWTRKDTC